jgi:hypothetical protein
MDLARAVPFLSAFLLIDERVITKLSGRMMPTFFELLVDILFLPSPLLHLDTPVISVAVILP